MAIYNSAQLKFTRFGSIKGVKEAEPQDVIAEIGAKKAEVVLKALASA